ncbi:MAG: NADH-quinone oxidoreductase subunit N, partial [Myxococcales bacterium]|nr:NADH-quinone oxidoreductase subunit N [Myxococcales bacterium]
MIAATDLMVLAPELFLGLAILILLLVGTTLDVEREGPVLHAMSLGTLAITAVLCLYTGDVSGRFFSGMIVSDTLRQLLNFIVIGAAAGTVLISGAYTRARGMDRSEYYLLLLLATLGMMLINAGGDLVVIFIGIETMSIAVYVLAGFRRNDPYCLEAAMKYFLFGAFATGFLLYGMALIYGATGTTNLADIHDRVQLLRPLADQPVLMAGIAMLVVGLGFKVAAVPFHAWTPDVYEGAPTSVTAFMSVGVKAAAFAAVLRVFNEALGPAHLLWSNLLYTIAVLSMIVGNVAAVVQSNVKRMLA